MRKILLLLAILLPVLAKAQTPFEFSLNDSGIALELTSKPFVIENYGDSFVTGNLMLGIEPNDTGIPPIMGFIFDDMSPRALSKSILSQSRATLKFTFNDGTVL